MRRLGLREGDIIVADGGHLCLVPGQLCVVHREGGDRFVFCDDGIHELDEGDDGEIVGFHPMMNGVLVQ